MEQKKTNHFERAEIVLINFRIIADNEKSYRSLHFERNQKLSSIKKRQLLAYYQHRDKCSVVRKSVQLICTQPAIQTDAFCILFLLCTPSFCQPYFFFYRFKMQNRNEKCKQNKPLIVVRVTKTRTRMPSDSPIRIHFFHYLLYHPARPGPARNDICPSSSF